MHTRWLPGRQLTSHDGVQMFCLPYAGGSAAVYRGWQELAPQHVQVHAVELPGRGSRMSEPPFRRLPPLVRSLADALEPVLDRPYALFGHSMGALVAFELARTLRERGQPPAAHLFVSGAAAPGTPRTRPAVHGACDEDLKRELRALNGTSVELLEDEELMALTLPTVRADLAVLETYEHRPEPPLPIPITVFGGMSDPAVPRSGLLGWRAQSTVGARVQLLPGDHFFLHSAAVEVLTATGGALAGHAREPERGPVRVGMPR